MATESNARAAAHRAGRLLKRNEELVEALDNIQRAVLAADVSNDDDTTVVAVTGFTAELEPGSYLFDYYLPISTAVTTTGVKFEPTFSGTGTRCYSIVSGTASATGMYSASATTGKVGPVDVPATSAVAFARLTGSIIVTAAGTLSLGFTSEVDTSAATVKAGASMRVEQV